MITYNENGPVDQEELVELFLKLEWQSGKYGDRLYHAVKNSGYYVTARNSIQELIGLISALDDGAINVYIPYALVHPDYQRRGIGKNMMKMLLEHYRDFLRITLISYYESTAFYQGNGFSACPKQVPMELSYFPKPE
jgi:GNAT superfamily N-acetyltransferase